MVIQFKETERQYLFMTVNLLVCHQVKNQDKFVNQPLMPRELHEFWISVQQWLIPVDKNKHFKSAWNLAGQVVLYLLWVKIKFRLKFLTWVDF